MGKHWIHVVLVRDESWLPDGVPWEEQGCGRCEEVGIAISSREEVDSNTVDIKLQSAVTNESWSRVIESRSTEAGQMLEASLGLIVG